MEKGEGIKGKEREEEGIWEDREMKGGSLSKYVKGRRGKRKEKR